MHATATIVIEHLGTREEVEVGTYPSRRAAKRAILGDELRRVLGRWPPPHSRAQATIEIGGREHPWLTSEVDNISKNEPTIGDLIRTQGYAVV